MTRRRLLALAIVLSLAAAACSDGVPDEYTVLEEPFVSPPRTGGDCFPYQSQIALIDPATGATIRSREVPWTFEMWLSGHLLILGHDDTHQPSGAIAVESSLEIVWQSQFPGRLDGVRGTRLLDDDRLLLRGRADEQGDRLIVADAATGMALMETDTPRLRRIPVEIDGTLLATSGEHAIGIDSESGEVEWREAIASSPAHSVLVAGDLLLIGHRNGKVTALDSNGRTRHTADSGLKRLDKILAEVEGVVFVVGGSTEGGRIVVAVDLESGTVLWSRAAAVGAAVLGDLLVFPRRNQGIRAADLETGEIAWQLYRDSAEVRNMRAIEDAVVATLRAENGDYLMVAIDAAPRDGPAWERLLEGMPTLGPEHFGDLVLVGGRPLNYSASDIGETGQGWLSAYSLESGDLMWSTILRESPADLIEVDNRIAVLTADPDIGCD